MKLALVVALALSLAALTGCYPVGAPGKMDKIEFVATSVVDGYKFDQYRNLAYPCSISGYQTFVIGTKVGSSDTADAAALGAHARRRRGLLRLERASRSPRRATSPRSRRRPRSASCGTPA